MPTYEYECTKCGYRFEVFQRIGEEHYKKCPECSGTVRRLISGGCGLIFKGSGFYITDYKRKGSEGNGKAHNKESGNGKHSATKSANNQKTE